MKKRKHITLISVAIVLIVLTVYFFFPQIYIKIVTQDVNMLERATVIVYDSSNEQPVYSAEIKEKAELYELYDKIKETKEIKVIRYPRHSLVEGASPEYEIQLYYSDGAADRFGTLENPEMVYRRLGNKDNGYILGQNAGLLQYVTELASISR